MKRSLYNVGFFFSHRANFYFSWVIKRLREMERKRVSHSKRLTTSQETIPLWGVELWREKVRNCRIYFILERILNLWKHKFKQDFVSLFVLKQLYDFATTYFALQFLVISCTSPIWTDTFAQYTGTELFLC